MALVIHSNLKPYQSTVYSIREPPLFTFYVDSGTSSGLRTWLEYPVVQGMLHQWSWS